MNIIFGVDTVDDMLKNVAITLEDYCGKSNVYRVGNDQFLLITSSHIICEPSELQKILKQPFKHHDIQYVINASVCVADSDDFDGDGDMDAVVSFADSGDVFVYQNNLIPYRDSTYVIADKILCRRRQF